ncbi:MAG: hypothetical protein M1834_000922 [Cirrosporium novae-zelandiae]|nr:MAG: hypothetical protein M1834_000922 [Cirrosporium novae-zelandiae]
MHYYAELLFAIFAIFNSTQCHSWVEDLSVINIEGDLTGSPGYSRGYVQRTLIFDDQAIPNPLFSDDTMTYLLPPNGRPGNDFLPTDLICMSSQDSRNETVSSPILRASPGSRVVVRYQENGHVTLQTPIGKPPKAGKTFIYGTNESSPSDTLHKIHNVWTRDGTGGNGRGTLLSEQTFDDGRCYADNGSFKAERRKAVAGYPSDPIQGANLWCRNEILLPARLNPGSIYTVYWVWDWPTVADGKNGKKELYTTCIDIEIV